MLYVFKRKSIAIVYLSKLLKLMTLTSAIRRAHYSNECVMISVNFSVIMRRFHGLVILLKLVIFF